MRLMGLATRLVLGVSVVFAAACSEKVETGPGSPYFASQPATTARVGVPYGEQVVAVDPQGSSVSYSVVTAPTGFSIDESTGAITWTPTADQAGPQNVHLRAKAKGDDGELAWQITVGYNQPPQIHGLAEESLCVGKEADTNIATLDPDGDPVTLAVLAGPDGFEIDPESGALIFTPDVALIGEHWVTISATDPYGGEAQEQVRVRVNGFGGNAEQQVRIGSNDPEWTVEYFDARPTADGNLWVSWIEEHQFLDDQARVFAAWIEGASGCPSTPMRVGPELSGHEVWDVRVAPAPDGSAYVLWGEEAMLNGAETYGARVQRVDADGAVWEQPLRLWNANSEYQSDYNHAPFADEAGLTVVFSTETDNDSGAHAQRVSPDGARLWGADGVQIGGGNSYDISRQGVIPDGMGGAYIVWNQYDAVRAQRLLPDGTLAWDEYGVVLGYGCGGFLYWPAPHAALDADGNLFAFWNKYEYCVSRYRLQVAKVDPSGERLWHVAALGGDTQYGERSYDGPALAVTTDGGVVVAHYSYNYGQLQTWKLDGEGGINWGPLNPGYGYTPSVSSVGGDAIVVWSYSGGGSENVFAQRLAAVDGSPVWNEGYPALVAGSPDDQYSPAVHPLGDGFVTWFWNEIYDPQLDESRYTVDLQTFDANGMSY